MRAMQARWYPHVLGLGLWCLGTAGCVAVVAPLEDVQPDSSDASVEDPTPVDGGDHGDDVDDRDEDAGIEPIRPDTATARPGERCSNADGCRTGSICAETQVCSVECVSDRDCSAGQCHAQSDGRRVCLYSCDPVGGDDCKPATTCIPTPDLILVPHAYCNGVKPELRVAVASGDGETCRTASDCEDGLGCMRTPDAIACTPWCRLHADCPEDRPLCSPAGLEVYVSDKIPGCDATQFECPADQVGLCVSCEFHTPIEWIEGPVWTLAEFQACQTLCPDNELSCIAAMCPGGDRFLTCFDAAVSACAGQLDGPCRFEYEALSCCVADTCRTSPDVGMCATTSCATESTAWDDCRFDSTDCLGTVAGTCVGAAP
jgi:hypothetical protein